MLIVVFFMSFLETSLWFFSPGFKFWFLTFFSLFKIFLSGAMIKGRISI